MHEEIKKLIEIQYAQARALFNSNSIDAKEFDGFVASLDKIKREIEEQKQRSLGFKLKKFFKRK